jgi:hypothetical protein
LVDRCFPQLTRRLGHSLLKSLETLSFHLGKNAAHGRLLFINGGENSEPG